MLHEYIAIYFMNDDEPLTVSYNMRKAWLHACSYGYLCENFMITDTACAIVSKAKHLPAIINKSFYFLMSI